MMLKLANLMSLNFLHNLYKGFGVSGIRSTMSARNPLEAFNNSINDSDLKNILKWTYQYQQSKDEIHFALD
jgi:hypothetical protein